MKQAYEKPVIVKLETGFLNKFGNSPLYMRRIREEIDGVAIGDVVSEYGSPVFVYSERQIRDKSQEVHRAFSSRYPNVSAAWSYKTNYLKAICAIYHEEGALAEVVSQFEYEKARALGIDGSKIIFNGPHKELDALRIAVEEGAQIHIDHLDEIDDLEQIAAELGRKIKVGIRLNMDTGIYPQWSRFGFNLDSGQALGAIKRMQAGGKLVVNGLHAHIGTYIMDPDAYATEVRKMVGFGYVLEDEFGLSMEFLDIGGGFPSMSRLKGAYLSPDVSLPSIDTYAEKITEALFSLLRPNDFPRLIYEAGRLLIDEAGYLITTVFASKRLPDGRRAYVLDAGINNLFTSFWYKFNVELDRKVPGAGEPAVLFGPLCMNIDVMDEGILLPPLNRGARLVFSPVGAYNNTQWLQFIEYRPPVVLVGLDHQVELIREREDLSDIERRERLPDRFLS